MSKPRLLIVGASGFLGQHLAREAEAAFDVFQADVTPPASANSLAMDITSMASVDAGFERAKPDAVVLLAAISDIDQCEQQPELAHAVNVGGAARVARTCASIGARFMFTSSAAVFDGTKHGYCESDPPTPLSVYGRTKALAEAAILSALPSAWILRMALVIGFAEGTSTNAMLNKLQARLMAGETVSFPDYEYRNPIDAQTLSRFVTELWNDRTGGLLHVGATDSISRFALGQRLAEEMGQLAHLIRAQTHPLPGRAPRGLNHFLLTSKLRVTCRTRVPACSEVIERAIHGSPQSNS